MNVIAIIPARGGSKRLPGKNIRPLLGKPLIAYAIGAAKSSTTVERVIVDTDDEQIAAVAREYGADVPFMRPAELATDTAKSIDVMLHAVNFLEQQGPVTVTVLIQGTAPLLTSADIDQAVEQVVSKGKNSCVTVCSITDRPEWMYFVDGDTVRPYLSERAHEVRTQEMPKLYRLNGSLWVTRRDTLMNQHVLVDDNSLGVVIVPRERSIDIDDLMDFQIAEILLRQLQSRS